MKKVLALAVAAIIGAGVGAIATHKADTNKIGAKAQSNQAASSPKAAQDLVMKITRNQFKINDQFKAGFGVTGFVIEPKNGGQPLIIYASQNGQFAFFGTLFNHDGQNLTENYVKQNIQPKIASKLMAEASQTHWFLEGKKDAPHQIYLVAEPNCSICHELYKNLQPFVKSGDLSIRWIMVAFLKQDSVGKAAAILNSKNPAAMLAKDEKNFDVSKESGGIKPLAADKISDKIKTELKANMSFFEKNGLQGTPVVIYKDKNGQSKVLPGYPREKLDVLVKSMGQLSDVDGKSAVTKTEAKTSAKKAS